MKMLTALALFSSLVPFTAGQVPTALLRQGDVPSTGATVDDVRDLAVNGVGGYAVVVTDIVQPAANVSAIWGSLTGGPGAFLRGEEVIGIYEQKTLNNLAITATEVVYTASSDRTSDGETGIFGVWRDDEIVAIEDEPSFEPGRIWSFFFSVGITPLGTVSFVASTADQAGGGGFRHSLHFGTDPVPLLIGGQAVPGIPVPLATSTAPGLSAFSSLGTHYASLVALETTTDQNQAIVLDGVGLELGGSLVRRGVPIPASIGGLPGEEWSFCNRLGVNEAGDYHFTTSTPGMFGPDLLIVANGQVIARAGDTIDGVTVQGLASAVAMNEAGDLAYIWNGESTSQAALFLNGKAVLREGDPVDWDGDGSLDLDTSLAAFADFNELRVAPDRTLYFVAKVDVNGTILEGLLRLDFPVGASYCTATPNSTGLPAALEASGSDMAAENDVTLFAGQMPLDQFGYFVNSQTQDFVPAAGGSQGNLCLGGAIGRHTADVFSTGATGTGLLALDLQDIPTPAGTTSVMAGQTWNFQAWYRDNNPGTTSNFTDGVSISFP